jgi:sugar-specific transcriptional regulator TrmB
MNDSLLEEALAALGLTPNAVTLYLQSYRVGRTTVGRLAQMVGMDRSSAHLAAAQLRAVGLLDEMPNGGRTLVWVKPPKEILTRLRIGMRKLRSQFDAVEDALPRLEAGYSEKDSLPVLQMFTGKDGLRQVVANILEHAEGEILLVTNQAAERQVFTRADHQEFIRERLRRGISIRALAVDTPEAAELVRTDGANLRETRIIQGEEAVPFQSETYIYGDMVAMLSFSEIVLGLLIRSADFAQAQRWMFERLWQESA